MNEGTESPPWKHYKVWLHTQQGHQVLRLLVKGSYHIPRLGLLVAVA